MITSTPTESSPKIGTAARRIGIALSALVGILLLLDSLAKLIDAPFQVARLSGLGFAASVVPILGAMLLVCVVLYAIPQTTVIGAVLITAYLGGAFCANIIGKASATLLISPIVVAIPVWLGLYLRSSRLREIVRAGR